jgi:hypothetical protein
MISAALWALDLKSPFPNVRKAIAYLESGRPNRRRIHDSASPINLGPTYHDAPDVSGSRGRWICQIFLVH